jgi:putative multiple sugar transport system substrate-binding protein
MTMLARILSAALLLLPFSMPVSAGDLAVGIVLPTRDQSRWLQDEIRFQALKAAGYNIEILFSQGDSAVEKSNVEQLIGEGARILIICPVEGSAAAAAADEAHDHGVKVISYDRLIRDSSNVDYYVTFDSVQVGAAWGRFLAQRAKGKGNNLYLYAGDPGDNNAFLFFQGAWGILQPLIADGTFVVRNSSAAVELKDRTGLSREEEGRIIEQVATNWSYHDAKLKAQANLATAPKAAKGTLFILGPNDDTSRAIADACLRDKDVKHYYITGQDADKASIQYIIDGKQSMTVLKDVRYLVLDAIAAAVAYLKGGTPASTQSYDNGTIDVAASPTRIVTVTRRNLDRTIFASEYYRRGDFKNMK